MIGHDVTPPPLSDEAVWYLDWFDMKVDGLSPNEYWATAAEDMQIAKALQRAVTHGVMRAEEEERAAQKAKQDKAEQERKTNESFARSRAKAGLREQ